MGRSEWKSRVQKLFRMDMLSRSRPGHTDKLSISLPVAQPFQEPCVALRAQGSLHDLSNAQLLGSQVSLNVAVSHVDNLNLAAASEARQKIRICTINPSTPNISSVPKPPVHSADSQGHQGLLPDTPSVVANNRYHQNLNSIYMPTSPFLVEGINSTSAPGKNEHSAITSFRGGDFMLSPTPETGRRKAGRSGAATVPQIDLAQHSST